MVGWKRNVIIVLVIALYLLAASSCVILPRRAFPKTNGTVTISGIDAPIEILRDSYGVAHIYGQTYHDLMFAQGYVHAQERFYQMEFQRRVGTGRLSELFGEATLETDIFLRTLGLAEVASAEYEMMSTELRASLDAYVSGVNAYLEDRKPGRISLEYTLLKLTGTDFEIEPWTAIDTITWAKMMAWSLGGNLTTERLLMQLLRTAGFPLVQDYSRPYRDDRPLTISDEERAELLQEDSIARVEPLLFSAGERSNGSNAWAIDGSRSASGSAVLVNDTHQGLQQPSIWYELGVHMVDAEGNLVTGPDALQARGFSFPGYPGVIIGHNDRIAWAITDYGDDVQDIYLERINPLNPNQYEVNGEWVDMEIRHERIDIQGQEDPFVLIARTTRHGPVITDRGGYQVLESYGFSSDRPFPENLDLIAGAFSWTALMPGELLECYSRLNLARNFDEFRQALSLFDGPMLHYVYADVDGNIGHQVAGRVPIRPVADGQIPVPGWTDEHEWQGFIPFQDLPFITNPEKGYVLNANNPAVGSDYPYNLGIAYQYGFRAARLEELIEGDTDGITVEDAIAIQADTYDEAGLEISSYLRNLDLSEGPASPFLEVKVSLDEKEERDREELRDKVEETLGPARELLLAWDGHMDIDSAGAAMYGFFYLALVGETFEDQYPADRWDAKNFGGREQNTFHFILEEPDNEWWDDVRTPDMRERRDDILVRAFRKGVRLGIEELGDDIEKWEWGDVHTTEWRNATLGESGITFVENLFNIGPAATPGSSTTVFAANWSKNDPFDVTHITTNRWIVDMGNLGDGLMVHCPGQSGHAKHRDYDSYVDLWRTGDYHPSNWNREDVEADSRGQLVLQPADR